MRISDWSSDVCSSDLNMASEAKMQGLELKRRIRPVEAFSAMKVLLRDKEDTAQVFRIVEALAGNSYYHHFRRFAESEGGRRILVSRSNLLEQDRKSVV